MTEEERLRAALLSRLGGNSSPHRPGSSRPPVDRQHSLGRQDGSDLGRDGHNPMAPVDRAGRAGRDFQGSAVARREGEQDAAQQHAEERRLEQQLASEVQWDALLSGKGREELDSLLFPPGAFIRAGSTLHREFGDFMEKYAAFRKKELARASADATRGGCRANAGDAAAEAGGSAGSRARGEGQASSGFGPDRPLFQRKLTEFAAELPAEYDQRYRINFAVVPPRQRAPTQPRVLGDEEIKEAKRALLLFEDFRQRKSITKIRKMRGDQRALPIFQFRDAIVAAVRREQVVLIAGDTGCGKSTQVPQYLIQVMSELLPA